MSVKVYQSKKNNAEEAVAEIKENLVESNPKLVVYFTSSNYDLQKVAEEFSKSFPEAETIGCTTAGEIISGSMDKNSIVAMALGSDKVKNLNIQVIENISTNLDLSKNIESINSELGSFIDLDINKYYGIILVDGLTGLEEKLMDSLGNATNINIVGGGAGDDLKFEKTNLMYKNKVYTDAAILTIVESAVNFDIIKTQSFIATDKVLTPTKVNPTDTREVIEFNNKPALEAYSEALGVSAEEAANNFFKHPVGLMVGDEPYVRSPRMAKENGAITFHCNISEGMDVKILDSTDIIEDTKKAVTDNDKSEKISGIINFNCAFRTLELESKNQTKEYGDLFSDIPTIGFSSFGEQFIGHMNQTSTMLAIK